jgi:hypothetical protein
MNADHVDAMILLGGLHAGIEATEATMTSVDRLGFSLRLKSTDGVKGCSHQFPPRGRYPPGHSCGARRDGPSSQGTRLIRD